MDEDHNNTTSPTMTAEHCPCSEDLIKAYETWALQNYGDSGKTKTVTRRKYQRIKQILLGDETASSDNSKFRFWVRAKGFKLGAPPTEDITTEEDQVVYIPIKKQGTILTEEKDYRRVAVVEDFFKIIYGVHVEMEGRGGKHAGQKRTYRAIAEMYSFLPREAVTRFLMSCADCQKRMHLSGEANNNSSHKQPPMEHNAHDVDATKHNVLSVVAATAATAQSTVSAGVEASAESIDYSLPFTTTYNRLKASNKTSSFMTYEAGDIIEADEDSMSSSSSQPTSGEEGEGSSVTSSSLPGAAAAAASTPGGTTGSGEVGTVDVPMPDAAAAAENGTIKEIPIPILNTTTMIPSPTTVSSSSSSNDEIKMVSAVSTAMVTERVSPMPPVVMQNGGSSLMLEEKENRGHPERKRKLSTDSLDSCVTKLSCDDVKDEDDNDDDDDDEKLVAMHDMDPERLKAFNMFVRLFVDENLDRMIPISKQPKDKVQAILEACDRQFPEFHDRSRKRIRTYLKSCRRLKRSKDSNGYEPLRPTPPHLTSAAAESILAQACENESQNAKRMRIGLEPLPAAVMNPLASNHLLSANPATNPATQSNGAITQVTAAHKPISKSPDKSSLATDYLRHMTPPPSSFRPPNDLPPTPFFANGGGGLFRPGFPSTYTPPAHQHASLTHASLTASLQNGPTDLSLKGGKTAVTTTTASAKSQLNPNEIGTIKQLIAGYRESAAFLYASADELEQLLLQQN